MIYPYPCTLTTQTLSPSWFSATKGDLEHALNSLCEKKWRSRMFKWLARHTARSRWDQDPHRANPGHRLKSKLCAAVGPTGHVPWHHKWEGPKGQGNSTFSSISSFLPHLRAHGGVGWAHILTPTLLVVLVISHMPESLEKSSNDTYHLIKMLWGPKENA